MCCSDVLPRKRVLQPAQEVFATGDYEDVDGGDGDGYGYGLTRKSQRLYDGIGLGPVILKRLSRRNGTVALIKDAVTIQGRVLGGRRVEA